MQYAVVGYISEDLYIETGTAKCTVIKQVPLKEILAGDSVKDVHHSKIKTKINSLLKKVLQSIHHHWQLINGTETI